jgi:hypothetical protein
MSAEPICLGKLKASAALGRPKQGQHPRGAEKYTK